MKVTLIDDTERFKGLEAEWNSLLLDMEDANIFLSFEWNYTWWRFFGSASDLFLLVVRDGERVSAIAPLAITRKNHLNIPMRVLEFMGQDMSDYNDIVVGNGNGDPIEEISQYLIGGSRSWDMINLQSFRDSSPHYPILANGLQQGYVLSNHHELYAVDGTIAINLCPTIEVNTHWDDYLSGLKPRLRNDLRRQLKRLKEIGEVTFVRYDQRDVVDSMLGRFFALHRERWATKGIESKFSRNEIEGFHRAIGESFLKNGWLDFTALELDGSPIAFHFGFVYRGVLYYYIPTFDPEYQNFSPGKLLFMFILEDAFKNGAIKEVDLLQGDEGYKLSWATGQRRCYQIRGYKSSLLGRALYLWGEGLRPRLTRVALLRRVKGMF